ncbi:PREDICTED: LEAF RUST 10 DISEASE-RESISTANCE LOCUS RECEPTOR-LIKE PROTEIN KINASE-like 1.5 isoform X2 [Nicotiana attenuata]|uniref:LEAF RUST 10 DISEASE-RESISTANCE LOCUS RECEPTOR-LIKE PROTEIN KINASE-like 1.5 isoform X2 n=1 Tax=Nicotiana attenuata TaxID=49451 RepID=UPI000905364A|nr:PREDICTED: LEAF RUST 10 DISEASE-RESISTANCE LOCUS RECEPTOR-LIKE PROTEIN KINASE-like 1.5 isoform X2 [Nicotiana attenuata]
MERLENLEKLRKELARRGDEPFYFQKDNYADSFMVICEKIQERMQSSLWRMTLPPLGGAKPYRFDDLKDMIENFDWDILKTTYGRFYEGVIRDDKGVKVQEVTIKTWDFFCPRQKYYADHPYTFCNELEILTSEDPHPNLMKIKGFCFQEALAVVYDEKPTMFLSVLLHFDTDFRLRGRIKVATQLASLIAWLHEKQFTVRAIDLSDIMIDEDLNIKVFDFIYLAPIGRIIKRCTPLFIMSTQILLSMQAVVFSL